MVPVSAASEGKLGLRKYKAVDLQEYYYGRQAAVAVLIMIPVWKYRSSFLCFFCKLHELLLVN